MWALPKTLNMKLIQNSTHIHSITYINWLLIRSTLQGRVSDNLLKRINMDATMPPMRAEAVCFFHNGHIFRTWYTCERSHRTLSIQFSTSIQHLHVIISINVFPYICSPFTQFVSHTRLTLTYAHADTHTYKQSAFTKRHSPPLTPTFQCLISCGVNPWNMYSYLITSTLCLSF